MSKIYILLLILDISLINSIRLNSKYCSAIVLSNNDIFLLIETGFYVYDSSFTNLKKSHNFTETQKILDISNDIEKISITQYSTSNGNDNIILCLVKNTLFIFSFEGEYIYEYDLNSYLSGAKYYSLVAYKYDTYYYYFITFNANQKMNIKYFKYLMNTNENTLLSDEQYSQINSLGNTDQAIRKYGLSCQIMITSDNKEVLSCFYQSNYPQEIGVNHFEITTTGISQINTIRQYISFDGAIVIKSMVSVDKKIHLYVL